MRRIWVVLGVMAALVFPASAQEVLSDSENSSVNLRVRYPASWSAEVLPDFGFSLTDFDGWQVVIGVGEGVTQAFDTAIGASPTMPASDALTELVKDLEPGSYDLSAAETFSLPQGDAIRISGNATNDDQVIPAMIITFNLPDGRLVASALLNEGDPQEINPAIYAEFEAIVASVESLSDMTTPSDAVAIADMPPGTVVFNSGVSLTLPEGWSLYSDEPFIRETAVIYSGMSYLSAGLFAVVTVNKTSELPIDFYRDFVLAFTAMIYTGREDFDAERDILTETLPDGREIQFLDVSEAETPMGNAFLIPINEAVYVAIIATVTSGDEAAQINEQLFEMARNMTITEPANTISPDTGGGGTVARPDLTLQTLTCSARANSLDISAEATDALVACPSNCANGGSVWGTDIYTLDSSVCHAAIHAGVITNADGGEFLLRWLPGQAGYEGSTRNAVTTSRWGSYSASFTFISLQSAPTTATQPPSQAALNLSPIAVACDRTVGIEDINSQNPNALYDCPAGCADEYYGVWGTDVYTLDSSICAAAIHSGAISNAEGGLTLLTWLPGQSEYPASERNSISSSSWGGWDNSFKAEPFDPSEGQ